MVFLTKSFVKFPAESESAQFFKKTSRKIGKAKKLIFFQMQIFQRIVTLFFRSSLAHKKVRKIENEKFRKNEKYYNGFLGS